MNTFKRSFLLSTLLLLSFATLNRSQETTESSDEVSDDGDETTTAASMEEKNLLTTIMSIVTTMSPSSAGVTYENSSMSSMMTSEDTTTMASSTTSTTTARPVPLSPCEKQLQISDQCTKQALFIGDYRDIEIPRDLDAMERMCREKSEDVTCIKEYGTKCLKNVPRQVFMGIIKNIRKLFQTYCKTPVGRQAFLVHMECIRSEHLAILNEVLGKLTLTLDYSATEVPKSEIITYACCSLHRTYNEVPQAMANICAPKATPADTVKFFQSLIRRSVGDILDVGCGKYASLEYCDANFKTGMTNIRSHLAKGLPLPNESFIVPLIKFTKKIDDSF